MTYFGKNTLLIAYYGIALWKKAKYYI